MKKKLQLLFCFFLGGCTGIPGNLAPIQNFEVNRYLGTWYEIARLDHSFERGLTDVSAEYSMAPNDTIRVVNRGYSVQKGKWKTAEGVAKFVQSPDIGHLKVSFFGPFYGSYIILDIDKETYQYALVCGPNKEYLWILSRQPTLDKHVLSQLIAQAQAMGFPTEELIIVPHTKK